jgi:hypothetical protein
LPDLLHHSFSRFLDDLFPDYGPPHYQRVLEIVSFLIVTSMLIGLLLAALVTVAYEL